MQNHRKVANIILEAVAYGFFGAVCVLIFNLTIDSLKTPCSPNFSCDSYMRGIPVGGVLIGGVFSSVFVGFLLGQIIKSEFTKWFLILTLSSITAILMQTVYFICKTDLMFEQIVSIHFSNERIIRSLGLDLMIELFTILLPFTLIFANRRFILEKIKNPNPLK